MATAPKAQGIMDLPENEDMGQTPQLSPMESYDAVTTALNRASPEAAAQYEQTMNASLPPELMNMSAEEISQLLQLFQYLQDNPEQYAAAIADLVKEGVIDEGDLPAEYDEEVLATVTALLMQALKTKQGPAVQEPQGFAMGGIADAARIVAGQGRSGDTMLAHITPAEAAMLRQRGGMGTVNPMTGLREYGWFSKLVSGVKNVVKAVVKPIVNVAKEIVKSPVGRIVATVALTAALGPAAASIGFSTAATAAAVSGGLTAISGGSLKDVLISSATAYFGAPGGPVSKFVGNLGISSIGAQAALASGITGTAAGLMQGKNLKDSLKSGLTQAAIGAGTAIGANYMSQPPGTRSIDSAIKNVFKPEDLLGDQIGGKVYPPEPLTPEQVLAGEKATVVDRNVSVPGERVAPVVSGDSFPSTAGVDGMPAMRPNMNPMAQAAQAPVQGGPVQGAPAVSQGYQVPGILDSAKTMGSGIMDIAQGNFQQGFDQLSQGAGDLFMPSGPTNTQVMSSPEYQNLVAQGMTPAKAFDLAKDSLSPGMIRSYAPAVAGGLGAVALAGGFEPKQPGPSALKEKLSGTPGEDLIRQDPNKYIVGNMPGVTYDEAGNIVSSQPWSPSQTLADVRVSPTTTAGRNLLSPYAPPTAQNIPMYNAPAGVMTAAGGQGIPQPYNTAGMYTVPGQYNFVPRYAAAGGMMYGGIANLSQGGYPRRNGQIDGPGTETSDSIPAMLSDGEFVMTAKAVRGAGGGSRREGAKRMYALMHQLERNAARG